MHARFDNTKDDGNKGSDEKAPFNRDEQWRKDGVKGLPLPENPALVVMRSEWLANMPQPLAPAVAHVERLARQVVVEAAGVVEMVLPSICFCRYTPECSMRIGRTRSGPGIPSFGLCRYQTRRPAHQPKTPDFLVLSARWLEAALNPKVDSR